MRTNWITPTLTKAIVLATTGGLLISAAQAAEPAAVHVGRQPDGSVVVPTHQRITPAGRQVELPGRPNEVAVRPGGGLAAVLVADGRGLRVRTLDLAGGRLLGDSGGLGQDASYAGLAWAPDGGTVYASGADGSVFALPVDDAGLLGAARAISIPTASSGTNAGQNPYPGGMAVSADGKTLYVALSRDNALGIVDVATGGVTKVPVGNAPHSVVVDGGKAYVSNEGGRPATPTDTTNTSAGTQIVSDPFGGGSVTGTVSVVDLAAQQEVRTINVGLHPTALLLDGSRLYVANTHGDSVSVVDTADAGAPVRAIPIQPFANAPYGSTPTGLAMLPGHRLAVTLGLANALAVFSLDATGAPTLDGLVPTAWYPSDVDVDPAGGGHLVVANLHGVGTTGDADRGKSARGLDEIGSMSVLPDLPPAAVAATTAAVRSNNGWDAIDTTCADEHAPARAIPLHSGEPSLIKHVLYVIKENRTYDQLLGDIGRGNSEPSLATFGRHVSPNTHALATQFPLMDNFYDSGRRSNDGHNWAVQGAAPDYLEKGVATKRTTILGPGRGTPPSSGFDALLYQPSGFIWENVLRHGKTFENFGEYTVEDMPPPAMSDVPSLQAHTVPEFSGFELTTPDTYRARTFANHLASYEAAGAMPNLITLTLPNDHTGGSNPLYPTPETQVADNDQGLGQIVDAVSHSSFWKDTAIFVEEDDTQGGPDHVEGHRGPLLVVSPYAKHGGFVDSTLYTQVDVVRTIELILGLPPMNLQTAAAHPLRTAFTDTPDLTPYDALVPDVLAGGPVMNPPLDSLTGIRRLWAQAAMTQDLTRLDAADPVLLNHDVWYATHDWSVPYPGETVVLAPDQVRQLSGLQDAEPEDALPSTGGAPPAQIAAAAPPALVVPPPPSPAPCTPASTASSTPAASESATPMASASESATPTASASASQPAPESASPSPSTRVSALGSPAAEPSSSSSASPAPTRPACPSPSSSLPVRVNTPTINATGLASVTVTGARPGAVVELQGYSQNHYGTAGFDNDPTPVDRSGTADDNGAITFDDLRPASSTRLRAHERSCPYSDGATGPAITVRAQETLQVRRESAGVYTFSGRSIPARPGGLIVTLYRVDGAPCGPGVEPRSCPSEVAIGRARATAEGAAGAGLYTLTVRLPGSLRGHRVSFVVKTGRDAQNAPGRSNVRSLLVA